MTTSTTTTMATTTDECFVGIDVAKAKLDVAILPTGEVFTLDYDDPSLIDLTKRLLERKPTLIVIEATGGYERRLAADLTQAGLAVAVVNPARVRQLAHATGTLAKNDRLDAKNLAQFAQIVRPRPNVMISQTHEELAALVARRRQLVEMIAMESNRRQQARATSVRKSIERVRTQLLAQRETVDKQIFKLLKSDDEFDGKAQLLASTPGVGPTTAATLVAELPELGTLSNKQIASLAGLAPFDRDSGTVRGKRFIRGGRVSVRVCLHMAALTATRCNAPIKAFYERLRAKGKSFRQAMVACARKLLTILNSLVKQNRKWTPTPA